MSDASADLELPPSLDALSTLLSEREHLLALGADGALSQSALQATKELCDLAISLEQKSHPHLHPFLSSILQPTIALRSWAKKEEVVERTPEELLPYTPLGELTADGLEPEQVWAQLELRSQGLCAVIKEIGTGEGGEEDEEGSTMGWEEEDDGEEGDSDEEMTEEEWKKMMAENGYEEGDSASGSEDEDSEDEMDLDEEAMEGLEGSDIDEDEEDDDEEGEEDEEDDDDEETLDGDDDDAMDDDDADNFAGSSKRPQHPTLDDQFFSIDEFNRQTEEMEASRLTSGALGGDEDEEAELDDVGAMFLDEEEGDEGAELMYSDFFEAPRPEAKDAGKGKKEKKADKRGKKKGVSFADEEEEEGDASRGVMDRVKADLFDESDDEGEEQELSTHEKRQRELAAQIAQLEQEAIGPKDWTLLGEATARARPENSLLEEDLDFEHVAKVVPQVTEELVASLEELIRKRILDNNFDSPVRVRAYDPTPFLPSRFFELEDKQSTKSLAQIYEDDYTASASGTKAADPRDEKLKSEHAEIERLWEDICYKLDALSSLNFVPKAPKAQITTIDNLPTTTLETALPEKQAASSMLAPQELFAGPSAGELQARSEQTPEEAKRARGKARKVRKEVRSRIAATEALYGKKRQTVKQQKDEALKQLVKSGKGVTVLGKGAKEDAKRQRRSGDGTSAGDHDAKRLKL